MFITLEGPDGSGKSTQAYLLAAQLRQQTLREVIALHEPGGTELGTRVRELLVQRAGPSIDPVAEALLFAAARAQLTIEVIHPALQRSAIVLVDRFLDSTLAYQGYGRGLPRHDLEALIRIATRGVRPDLTILLDLDPEIGLERRLREAAHPNGKRTAPNWNRFEDELLQFHRRTYEGYHRLAAEEPERWKIVDASGSVEVVQEAIWQVVTQHLNCVDSPRVKAHLSTTPE